MRQASSTTTDSPDSNWGFEVKKASMLLENMWAMNILELYKTKTLHLKKKHLTKSNPR